MFGQPSLSAVYHQCQSGEQQHYFLSFVSPECCFIPKGFYSVNGFIFHLFHFTLDMMWNCGPVDWVFPTFSCHQAVFWALDLHIVENLTPWATEQGPFIFSFWSHVSMKDPKNFFLFASLLLHLPSVPHWNTQRIPHTSAIPVTWHDVFLDMGYLCSPRRWSSWFWTAVPHKAASGMRSSLFQRSIPCAAKFCKLSHHQVVAVIQESHCSPPERGSVTMDTRVCICVCHQNNLPPGISNRGVTGWGEVFFCVVDWIPLRMFHEANFLFLVRKCVF